MSNRKGISMRGETYRRLKAEAEHRGKSISETLDRICHSYLDELYCEELGILDGVQEALEAEMKLELEVNPEPPKLTILTGGAKL